MSTRSMTVAAAVGVVVVIALVIKLMYGSSARAKPEPSVAGYYTGPMLNKSGTAYTTEDSRVVRPASRPTGSQAPAGDTGGRSVPP